MSRHRRFTPAFTAACTLALALAAPGAHAAPRGLPFVGTIESVDVEGRKLTLLGPDGKSRTWSIPEDGAIIAEFGAAPTLPVLAAAKGKPVAVIPRSSKEAQFVSLLNIPADPVERGWLRDVLEDELALRFETVSGPALNYSPAVNLGASAAEGEAPTSADWAWFEKRIGSPFEIKVVRVAGRPFLWSVTAWTPKEDEKPVSEGRTEKKP